MSITLAELRAELAPIKAKVDGIPFIHRSLEALRDDVRKIRAALIDLASLQISTGDAQVLHADINKMETKQIELEARMMTECSLLAVYLFVGRFWGRSKNWIMK
jgi:hypothetical protein